MKRGLFIAFIFVVFVILVITSRYHYYDINKSQVVSFTTIQLNQTIMDLGQIQQGKPQTVHFTFKNTGEFPLVIQQVEASCGCTEPEWPKQPIKPGRSGEIKVTYDAKYPGRFVKSIKVFCNSEKGVDELVVKGEVKEL